MNSLILKDIFLSILTKDFYNQQQFNKSLKDLNY